jgi:leucyl-tRNA---protein transferase
MRSDSVRLFQTLPHACGYYSDRTAQNLVIDPSSPNLDRIYPLTLARGFRRAGGHLYHPHCGRCRACVACRIAVERFEPDRGQRRCLRRNADLVMRRTEPGFSAERYRLYRRYLRHRHPGGGMDEADAGDFERFLAAPWSPTEFLEFRAGRTLLAVAVTDVTAAGLSAVYTFFEPDLKSRSLGTYAILSQIELARHLGLRYVYLGFWIEGHPKMDYKRRFAAAELLGAEGWRPLGETPSV